jgi:hypothetical protein
MFRETIRSSCFDSPEAWKKKKAIPLQKLLEDGHVALSISLHRPATQGVMAIEARSDASE